MFNWAAARRPAPPLRIPAGGRAEFRDPNQEWELAAYRDNSDLARRLRRDLDLARQSGALAQWSPGWVRFVAAHVGAWMHVEHGLGQHLQIIADRAPTSMHANAVAANGARRTAAARNLALYNLTMARELAGFNGSAHRRAWHLDPAWQGVRHVATLITSVDDWAEAFFAVNVVFEPLVGELFRSRLAMPAAERHGDSITPTLLRAAEHGYAARDLCTTVSMFRLLGEDRLVAAPAGDRLTGWLAGWTDQALHAARAMQPLWSLTGSGLQEFEDDLASARRRLAGIAGRLGLSAPEAGGVARKPDRALL